MTCFLKITLPHLDIQGLLIIASQNIITYDSNSLERRGREKNSREFIIRELSEWNSFYMDNIVLSKYLFINNYFQDTIIYDSKFKIVGHEKLLMPYNFLESSEPEERRINKENS